jgi:hypothetical protein
LPERRLLDVSDAADSRVVEQDVDPSVLGKRGRRKCLGLLFVRAVGDVR